MNYSNSKPYSNDGYGMYGPGAYGNNQGYSPGVHQPSNTTDFSNIDFSQRPVREPINKFWVQLRNGSLIAMVLGMLLLVVGLLLMSVQTQESRPYWSSVLTFGGVFLTLFTLATFVVGDRKMSSRGWIYQCLNGRRHQPM